MYHYNSPQLGGFGGASKEMFCADPDFAMGKVMTWGLGVFGVREETAYMTCSPVSILKDRMPVSCLVILDSNASHYHSYKLLISTERSPILARNLLEMNSHLKMIC